MAQIKLDLCYLNTLKHLPSGQLIPAPVRVMKRVGQRSWSDTVNLPVP
ncbi:MAG: hypothetical protein QOE70_4251 [Chthoniobacter sp.]|jgi:hypothetical protein|nr:hypothetical protein [Chthoniobacter sp.]